MKWLNKIPEPLTLVLIVTPVVFLLLPDGIPFVYAGCVSTGSHAATCTIYSFGQVFPERCGPITISGDGWKDPAGKCGVHMEVLLYVEEGYDNCELCWHKSCDNGNNWCGQCEKFKIESGKFYNADVFCDSCQDKPYIQLEVANTECGNCTEGSVLGIVGAHCDCN